MTDTLIKEDQRQRQLGGGLLIIVGLPLTLLIFLFGLSLIRSISDIAILLPGPFILAAGLWAAFPRHLPKVKMTISDQAITIASPPTTIALEALEQISRNNPIYAKFTRLTFKTAQGGTAFDVDHLTHQHKDIISQISIRLEKQGKFLVEGETDVLGAANGIWDVREGAAFATNANHAKNTHGRK